MGSADGRAGRLRGRLRLRSTTNVRERRWGAGCLVPVAVCACSSHEVWDPFGTKRSWVQIPPPRPASGPVPERYRASVCAGPPINSGQADFGANALPMISALSVNRPEIGGGSIR